MKFIDKLINEVRVDTGEQIIVDKALAVFAALPDHTLLRLANEAQSPTISEWRRGNEVTRHIGHGAFLRVDLPLAPASRHDPWNRATVWIGNGNYFVGAPSVRAKIAAAVEKLCRGEVP